MNYLIHHGVNKQRWGIRRFQYEDGGLTPAGKEHYRKGTPASAKRFDTGRYSKEDGSLTYMGNQKFAKSKKFNELRRKRKSKNNVGNKGISLVTASVSNTGSNKTNEAISHVGYSVLNGESAQNLTQYGVSAVSMLFGGLPAV